MRKVEASTISVLKIKLLYNLFVSKEDFIFRLRRRKRGRGGVILEFLN